MTSPSTRWRAAWPTGELVDPFGGVRDLARRELRTVGPTSFREDPLRLLRGLRLVSQLGFQPAGETLAQMRLEARRPCATSRRSGSAAGRRRTARASSRCSCSAGSRARALRLARDTGVLSCVLPEFREAIGYWLDTPRQPFPLDEHCSRSCRQAADCGRDASPCGSPALLHDLGKPEADRSDADDHAASRRGACRRILRAAALSGPAPAPRRRDRRRATRFQLDGRSTPAEARRFLAAHGASSPRSLMTTRTPTSPRRTLPADGARGARERFRDTRRRRAGTARTTLRQLAVDGDDLIAIGFREGPELGRVLRALLDDGGRRPEPGTTREPLLERARAELA